MTLGRKRKFGKHNRSEIMKHLRSVFSNSNHVSHQDRTYYVESSSGTFLMEQLNYEKYRLRFLPHIIAEYDELGDFDSYHEAVRHIKPYELLLS